MPKPSRTLPPPSRTTAHVAGTRPKPRQAVIRSVSPAPRAVVHRCPKCGDIATVYGYCFDHGG